MSSVTGCSCPQPQLQAQRVTHSSSAWCGGYTAERRHTVTWLWHCQVNWRIGVFSPSADEQWGSSFVVWLPLGLLSLNCTAAASRNPLYWPGPSLHKLNKERDSSLNSQSDAIVLIPVSAQRVWVVFFVRSICSIVRYAQWPHRIHATPSPNPAWLLLTTAPVARTTHCHQCPQCSQFAAPGESPISLRWNGSCSAPHPSASPVPHTTAATRLLSHGTLCLFHQ